MASANSVKYPELMIELETTKGSGTFTRVCGLYDYEINRSTETSETKIPDCDDESKPLSVEKDIVSTSMSISGSGIMAKQSSDSLLSWFHSGEQKLCRVYHSHAQTGEIEYETGNVILSSLGDSKQKEGSSAISRSIELQFAGEVSTSLKA
jgi:predicted secreted protein